MKKMKKLLALGIALAMTATVFAGCGNKAAGSDAKDGNTLVYGSQDYTAINPALYEAAQIDGAGSIKRLIKITLPNLLPTLFTVTVLSLLNSFKVFREAYLIAGSYPDNSIYMLQHLFNNWYSSLDVDKMCAGAVMMAFIVFTLIMLLQKIMSGGDGS